MQRFILGLNVLILIVTGSMGWADTHDSFRLSDTHSLEKLRLEKEFHTERKPAETIYINAARNEAESFQLIVIPTDQTLEGVTVETSPLTGPGTIELKWRIVDYVQTGKPGYPVSYVGWWPDPLLHPSVMTVPVDRVGVLWCSVLVPERATPGEYKGTISVRWAQEEKTVKVQLRVWDFTIPRPGTLAMPFGLYAPILSRWQYGMAPYEEKMPVEKFAQWCEFMGEYRLTPKNIGYEYVDRFVNEKPMPQMGADASKYISGIPEPGIETRKDLHYHQSEAGTALAPVEVEKNLRVDMTDLHKTVGILAPRYYPDYSLGLYRLPTAPFFREGLIQKNPQAVARPYDVHAREWQRQNLPGKVFVYGVDEPRDTLLGFLRETYLVIKKDYPDIKIMQTISHKNPSKLIGAADIWCPLTPSLASDFYQQRREAGDMLWSYVCVSPRDGRHANFFIDEPAIDHRVLFWQCRQYGVTGFLYWAVCWWDGFASPADSQVHFPDIPLRIEDHIMYKRAKVNGDGFLMYPDKDFNPMPSIRLEVIRDGVEDYEYFVLLDLLIERFSASPESKSEQNKALLQKARELSRVPETISKDIVSFTRDPKTIFDQRKALGEMIETLTIALAEETN